MNGIPRLNKPWMIAVWPGIGEVAISAGYYLVVKLEMHLFGEFKALELFDVEEAEIKGGLIRTGRLPRSRLFVWNDPAEKRDIVVFIGEAQPRTGKYTFCHRLVNLAQELGVERMFTFAAIATRRCPRHASLVFGAAADEDSLAELKQLELPILQEGHIDGLNGVLLGIAAECGMRGACLLGEVPALFAQLPFPKASLAVLETFTTIAGLEFDLTELREQAEAVDSQLEELLAQLEQAMSEQRPVPEETFGGAQAEERRFGPQGEQRIERLFEQAQQDRSKAYELKRELDRLGVFMDYEDRFLDLFKKPE
jgi:uncharacterized protein